MSHDTAGLDRLIEQSEGSLLVAYAFGNKSLSFQLFHAGLGSLLSFVVPTDTVHGRTVSADPRRSACRIELIDLEAELFVREGRYLPPTESDQFEDHARGRLTLAYGRRHSEYRCLLRLRGAYPLLACLVRDPGQIRWTTD